MKQVDLIGIHVEAESGMPMMLLREQAPPHRVLPVFIGAAEANSIALAVSGRKPPRPLTHDLMTSVLEKLGSHVDAVEVTELTDGAFHAALVLMSPDGSHRIDTRPSDAIALAVRNGAPIFAAEAVLEEAGTIIAERDPDAAEDDSTSALAPEEIEAEIEAFRSALEELDPAELATAADSGDEAGDETGDVTEAGDGDSDSDDA